MKELFGLVGAILVFITNRDVGLCMSETRECPACGQQHVVLQSLPEQPLSMATLEELNEKDGVLYAGPTMISFGDGGQRTPMIVLQTRKSTRIVSFYEKFGEWLVTLTDDTVQEENGEYGTFVNEMATQVIEAGYTCAQEWLDDGEPGGRVPV